MIVGGLITFVGGQIKFGEEAGINSLLTFQCGGIFGWTSITTPLVRQSIYKDSIVIAYGYKRHKLLFEDINSVTKPWHLFSHAIRYNHKDISVPKKIIIHTKRADEVLEVLRLHNIKVKKKTKKTKKTGTDLFK